MNFLPEYLYFIPASVLNPVDSIAATLSGPMRRLNAPRFLFSSAPAARPTVISNGAGRRFFFRIRSCECVGLRREKSLFALFSLHRLSGIPAGIAPSFRFSNF
jgi:hypothetical protein